MKKIVLSVISLMTIIGSSNTLSASQSTKIFDNITLKGEIRPRLESADIANNGKEGAQSFTVRTHLTITSQLLGVDGLTSSIGIQSVNNFGGTNYNSTQNANTKYDVIADAQLAMLSEATLDYKSGKNALHVGRSKINLDNQRFIGTVGWRQQERSYDTAYFANSSVKGLNVLAAYVYGYAGVKNVITTETNSILLHAKYKVSDALNVTTYAYLLASIHDTYGLALTGKIKTSMAKLSYRAEYAIQSDPTMEYRQTGVKADASYINLDLGVNISGILAGINYESLGAGSNANNAFSTPLATGHKFNGWADMFLKTPNGGLIDANVRIGYKAKGFGKLLAVYHSFTSENSMASTSGTTNDLGTEIDAVYVNKIPMYKNLKGLLKIASYSKGAVSGYTYDKQVIWAQLDYKF